MEYIPLALALSLEPIQKYQRLVRRIEAYVECIRLISSLKVIVSGCRKFLDVKANHARLA